MKLIKNIAVSKTMQEIGIVCTKIYVPMLVQKCLVAIFFTRNVLHKFDITCNNDIDNIRNNNGKLYLCVDDM